MNKYGRINIRVATLDDINRIAEICESNSILYDPILPGAFIRQAGKFRKNGLPNSYEVLVIDHKDKIVGFLGTKEFNNQILYLVAIYLHSTNQRNGIGGKVLGELIRHYKFEGYEEIVLLVHQEASWAKSFYSKYQFQFISNFEEEIKEYGNGILSDLYIPNTELLRLIL